MRFTSWIVSNNYEYLSRKVNSLEFYENNQKIATFRNDDKRIFYLTYLTYSTLVFSIKIGSHVMKNCYEPLNQLNCWHNSFIS